MVGVVLIAAVLTAAEPAAKPLAKADIDKLVVELGSDDFAKRQSAEAGLVAAGEQVRAAVDALAKDAKDAEVRSRAQRIIQRLNMPRDFATLSAAQKEIAKLPFQTDFTPGAKETQCQVYGHDDYTLIEIANVRLALESQPYNGQCSCTVVLVGQPGRSSASSAGSFSSKYANGVSTIKFRTLACTIKDNVLKIGETSVPVGGEDSKKIVFVAKDGKPGKVIDMPVEKEKKDDKKDELKDPKGR
jgi:hypothetical protein